MTATIQDILNQFDSISLIINHSKHISQIYLLTNQLIENQIDKKYIVQHFIQYFNQKKYIIDQKPDPKIIHILKILSHFKDVSCLTELIKLTNEQILKIYLKDIYHCIGQIKSEDTRQFLKTKLKNDNLSYLCAVELAYFPDPSGIKILEDNFQKKIDDSCFSEELFNALLYIRSIRVWKIVENYLDKDISEKERYRVCTALINVRESKVIPLLIDCYKYYDSHKNINYQDVKSISMEDENLALTTVQKEFIPFPENMKKKIITHLIQYQSDFRVKVLLRNLQ